MKLRNFLKFLSIIFVVVVFTSCSALHTSVSKRNLDVQTKMSDTIWLEPVAPSQKTIFVQIRNTSGKELRLEEKVIANLQKKGYTVVSNPNNAHYWLQANVLKVDKVDLREGNQDSFANSILAGGVGAMLGGQRSGGVYTAVGWGLAAATVSTIADALVKDISYAMVTDILITQKTGKIITTTTKNMVKQGTSGASFSTATETTNADKYSTRILSIANKVNLKFEDAVPLLEDELVKSLSGIF